MEPGGFIPGAEAQRWLSIAERLLSSGDFVGCKTFAIRARETDPSFDLADQILACADTLIAGEMRVNNNQRDWYAILQLVGQTNDSELIAAQYSRLALLLNPNRNRLPFADQAFRLVFEAWSVLSNLDKKTLYDNMLEFYSQLNLYPPGSTSYGHGNQEQQQWQQQQQPRQQQEQQRQQQPLRQQQQQPKKNSQCDRNITPGIQEENMSGESSHDQSSTFWTACPYCFHMYEYLKVYVDCTLRCQNCRSAFQAVGVRSPPQVDNEEDVYFYCWGYFPIGITESNLRRINGGGMGWTPFSSLLSCPQEMEKNGVDGNVNVARKKKVRSSAPRIYVDDEDIFVEMSDSSDDSDDDWNGKEKKKVKSVKNKGTPAKNIKKSQVDKANNARGGSGTNLNPQSGVVVQEEQGASNILNAQLSKKVTSNAAKRTGKVAKELRRLDLNVELNNEVEEPALRVNGANGAGNGVEDNIEGTGFFEGLDEFLDSLPILSVVNDKVKAA